MSTSAPSERPPRERPERSTRRQTRLVVAGVAAALAAVFAVVNLNQVKVHWVFDTTRSPLILVIVVAFGLGIVAGLLIARSRS